MPSPQPVIESASRSRLPAFKRKRHLRKSPVSRFPLRPLYWEMTAGILVNVAFGAIAVAAIARLVPYYHQQRQALEKTEAAVEVTNRLLKSVRSDFSRHFDSAPASQGLEDGHTNPVGSHVPVVLVDPLAPTDAAGDR